MTDRHPPPREETAEGLGDFLRYVIARPLMVLLWGVALFLSDPIVLVPVLVAVVAWMVLGFALRAAAGRG